MQLTYQKPGVDHPMYGQVDYIVADGMTPLCYKTSTGYRPLNNADTAAPAPGLVHRAKGEPLYVLSFKVNDDAEELTFRSQKALEKTLELYAQKPFITEVKTTTYYTVADTVADSVAV
jgi:hypothetical protein